MPEALGNRRVEAGGQQQQEGRRRLAPWSYRVSRGRRLTAVLAAAVLAAIAAAVTLAAPARAAAGTWASWTRTGGSGGFTGTESVTGTGFPGATFTSDAARLTVPAGGAAYLNAATPPGTAFGSSQGRPYLNIGTASGDRTSTTTLTFDAPTPASGWAIVVGDVDADQVQIEATGPSGARVPVSGLGFQGAFNYCGGAPLPGTCGGVPGTDEPAWNPAAGVLRGNGADTSGASGWFEPGTAITSLTFRFSTLTPGTPIFQLWLVSLAQPSPPPTPSPSATATSASPSPPPPSPSPSASVSTTPSARPSPSRSLVPSPPLVPVTG
jgi:hypothetical protein